MDEYLKILLDQIRCKKARLYIKQELQDHMEDQIEANMSAGMNYEQAEKEAVRDMGDPVEIGISLDSIHKPQIAWKLLVIIAFVSMIGVFDTYRNYRAHRRKSCSCLRQIYYPRYDRIYGHDVFISFGLYCTSKILKNNCSDITAYMFCNTAFRRHNKREQIFPDLTGK